MSELPELDYLQQDDTKIPIPTLDHLHNLPNKNPLNKKEDKDFKKHERAYDAFCRWSGLPEDLRNPKTIVAFERKYKVPAGYTGYFRQRDDYRDRTLKYFWEWAMDKFPDVMQSVYKGALKGNAAQAKTFIELMSKYINLDKPQQVIQPITLVGVPQQAIDQLFVPKGYEKVKEVLPGEEVEK